MRKTIQEVLRAKGVETKVIELPESTRHQEVWAAAGTPHAVFNLKSSLLIELTLGKIGSIK